MYFWSKILTNYPTSPTFNCLFVVLVLCYMFSHVNKLIIIDPGESFNNTLNSVHPRLKFTREEENDSSIAFLDLFITRHENGSLSTKIYRKPTNTNVIIKPNSCHHPSTHAASFKGELCRARRLCSSPTQVKREINYTLESRALMSSKITDMKGKNSKKLPPRTSRATKPTTNKLNSRSSSNNSNSRLTPRTTYSPFFPSIQNRKKIFVYAHTPA